MVKVKIYTVYSKHIIIWSHNGADTAAAAAAAAVLCAVFILLMKPKAVALNLFRADGL